MVSGSSSGRIWVLPFPGKLFSENPCKSVSNISYLPVLIWVREAIVDRSFTLRKQTADACFSRCWLRKRPVCYRPFPPVNGLVGPFDASTTKAGRKGEPRAPIDLMTRCSGAAAINGWQERVADSTILE